MVYGPRCSPGAALEPFPRRTVRRSSDAAPAPRIFPDHSCLHVTRLAFHSLQLKLLWKYPLPCFFESKEGHNHGKENEKAGEGQQDADESHRRSGERARALRRWEFMR